MDTFYVLAPTNSDVLHYGKGHDDNPPGRGSGRYAFGTGKRSHQHVISAEPKDKETVLKYGNAQAVLNIQSELTNKELREAVDRLQQLETIQNYDEKQRWGKVNSLMKHTDNIVNWALDGTKAWNIFASIYNFAISNKTNITKLPLILR